jgi:hypothetical protein
MRTIAIMHNVKKLRALKALYPDDKNFIALYFFRKKCINITMMKTSEITIRLVGKSKKCKGKLPQVICNKSPMAIRQTGIKNPIFHLL